MGLLQSHGLANKILFETSNKPAWLMLEVLNKFLHSDENIRIHTTQKSIRRPPLEPCAAAADTMKAAQGSTTLSCPITRAEVQVDDDTDDDGDIDDDNN